MDKKVKTQMIRIDRRETYSETWRKTSSPPLLGTIKPCPFSRQNVLIFPWFTGAAAPRSDLPQKRAHEFIYVWEEMKAPETVSCGDSIDATIQDSPNGVMQN